jgi:hypothetical protein
MKDRKGNNLIEGCILQSTLGGKESTKITYKGDGLFECPGEGTINHTQETLLASYWAVIETPTKEKNNG